jgi:hypothetical protein
MAKGNQTLVRGLAWFKNGIWKLRGLRRGFEKERCLLCREEDDAVHILLKCSAAKKWREQYLSSKWLNGDVAFRK